MNSAELPVLIPLRPDASPWENVRRIYRRICLLRAQHEDQLADDIEHHELPRALTAARLSAPEAVDEAALLAEENARVANAAVLAELLTPLLADRLSHPSPDRPPRDSAAPVAASPVRPPGRPVAKGPPGIADLIDGMLEQDHSRRRS